MSSPSNVVGCCNVITCSHGNLRCLQLHDSVQVNFSWDVRVEGGATSSTAADSRQFGPRQFQIDRRQILRYSTVLQDYSRRQNDHVIERGIPAAPNGKGDTPQVTEVTLLREEDGNAGSGQS